MEILRFSFDAVVPLILLVVLGFFLVRWQVINEDFINVANRLCFQVSFPVSLFISITEIDLRTEIDWALYILVITGIAFIVLALLLTVPRLVKGNPQRGALIQGIYRGNFLLMGYPLARNLFGEPGIIPVVMLLPVVIILFNLIAVILLEYYDQTSHGFSLKKIVFGVVRNPLIIGAVLGVVFSLLRVELPLFLGRAADDVAASAYPLALILLGGQFKWHKLAGNGKMLASAVLVRMFLIPLIMISAAVCLGFRGPQLGAVFILFGAPTAVSSYIMARNMNSDADLAGQIVLLTTILSGLTFFAGAFALRALQLF
jgi:malate permease and related proteins